MKTFESFKVKNLELKNRIVMAPMCMYSSDDSGMALDFHRVHYGSRAVGGAGLIIQEATAVTPQGRISEQDLGIWEDAQVDGLASIVQHIHSGGSFAGIQLAHAGRKSEVENQQPAAPSALFFNEEYPVPHELTVAEIHEIVNAFGLAGARAAKAGYDVIEIHGAHGYLIHSFLSPLSNQRTDQYGGSFANRLRFLQEVIAQIRLHWPAERVLALRLSASDFLENGLDINETIRIVDQVKSDIDLVHLSSGGLLSAPMRPYPGYQVGFAEAVRSACKVPTIAVGLITSLAQTEEILGNGRADLVALGRELLRNPYWPIRHSTANPPAGSPIPSQYERAWHNWPKQS